MPESDFFVSDLPDYICTFEDKSELPCCMCHEDLSCEWCYYAVPCDSLP